MKILLFLLISLCSLQITNGQWMLMNNGMGNISVNALTTKGSIIFAGTGTGIYKSTDYGANWSQVLVNLTVFSLAANANDVFAGIAYSNGVYKSTNNGANWNQILFNQGVPALAVNGMYIFAGTFNGVHFSSDNGTTWSQAYSGRAVGELAINGNNIFAGTIYTPALGVYLSTNNGTNWVQTTLNNRVIGALAINGNNIFAGTYLGYGLYSSTDNGNSWSQTCLNNHDVISLALSGNNIFSGTDGNGVYAGCVQRNEGLGNLNVNALCVLNNYVFAGTGAGIYRRPLEEFTGIKQLSSELPNGFKLFQNYPNPFNPTTHFGFQIADFGLVKLLVYDVLGRVVETLVNEQLQPGSYEIEWDASDYPSGVYFYTLEANEYKETKKLVLLK